MVTTLDSTRQAETRQPIEAGNLPDALLNVHTVAAMTGLCRANIYHRMSTGDFPQPVRLGRRCSRWPAAEVRRWIRAKQEQPA